MKHHSQNPLTDSSGGRKTVVARFVDAPHFMTAQQVGELLQIHVKTVYDLAYRGVIPSIKVGGSRRFPRKQLLESLDAQAESKTVESLPSIHELPS